MRSASCPMRFVLPEGSPVFRPVPVLPKTPGVPLPNPDSRTSAIVIAILQCPAGIQLCGNCTVVEAEPIGRRDPLRLLVCFQQQSAGVEIQILPRMELLLFPISLRKEIVAGCIRVQQFKKSQCLPAVAVGRRQAPALRRDRAVLNGRPQRDGSQLCATGPGVAVQ